MFFCKKNGRTLRSFFERYVLFRSCKYNLISDSALSGTALRLGKERNKERSVLFKGTEKNGKNGTFFCKERKRTERTFRSFEKNGKERKERSVLLKRTERTFRSLEKNGKERKERNVLLKRTDAQPCDLVPKKVESSRAQSPE